MSKKKQSRTYRTREEKLKIINFSQQRGVKKAEQKYKISRSMIYQWKSALGWSPETPQGTHEVETPAQPRQMRKSKKASILTIGYATTLEKMAQELMFGGDQDEALALFAGAAALRERVAA